MKSLSKSISYLIFRRWRCCLYVAILTTNSAPTLAANSQPGIDYDQASTLLTATSKISVTNEKLLGNLQLCREMFPHLTESSDRARQEWLTRNQLILQRSAAVSEYVVTHVKQDSSPFVAEKMVLDMELSVTQEVDQFLHEFRNKDRKQQHYLCNRLILSISAGEHDLERQNATESKQLLDFKP